MVKVNWRVKHWCAGKPKGDSVFLGSCLSIVSIGKIPLLEASPNREFCDINEVARVESRRNTVHRSGSECFLTEKSGGSYSC
jgi:hypothetical protein